MSSAGQAVGGIVGAVIGFYAGGPSGAVYGAQVGMAIGGAIDPPEGPVINGPRLDDLSLQTSTYGAFIPRNYGTIAQTGNIFWLKGDKLTETPRAEESGGKGGPTTTTKLWDYSATFALGLCEGPIDGIRRIWINGQLWYDAAVPPVTPEDPTGLLGIVRAIASNESARHFTLYKGDDAQLPDPLMQADKGIDNVPAYRGLAYVVFEDLPLAKYNNSLAGVQIKVEIAKNATEAAISVIGSYSFPYSRVQTNIVFLPKPYYISLDRVRFYSGNWDSWYPAESSIYVYDIVGIQSGSAVNTIATVHSGSDVPPNGNTDKTWQYFKDADELFGSGVSLEGVDGTFICRNGRCLGYSRASTGIVYLNKNPILTLGTITSPLPGNAHSCVAVDPDGYNYVIGTNGITVYDDFLNVVDTIAYTFVTLDPGAAKADIADGNLWILSSANGGTLYRMDISTQVIESLGSIPAWPLDYYTEAEFRVINGTLIQAAPNSSNSTLNVRALRFYSMTPSGTTLGHIVESECLTSKLLTAGDVDVTELTDSVRGYRVASLGALRGGIDPLRAAWPFDVVQHGYQIKFKRRGSASVATIDASELDARAAGENPGVQITNSREMDTLLPSSLRLKYLDSVREYDTNEQISDRGL